MPVYTDLDIRMKNYEKVTDQKLIRKMPVLIRIDGRAFHTFTKGFNKPFDDILINAMKETTKYLCENVQNCVLGYTQSDEISLLLVDYKELDTQPWFDNRIQKIVSNTAALATDKFKEAFINNIEKFGCENIPDWDIGGTNEWLTDQQEQDLNYIQTLCNAIENKYKGFDVRCWNIPKDEVTNYFFWRQQDCIRNSIQMVGQANFSHKELQNKSCNQIQDMLMERKGINWNDLPIYQKRGSCCVRNNIVISTDGTTEIVQLRDSSESENVWIIDKEIPIFKGEGRKYIDKLVYVGEQYVLE